MTIELLNMDCMDYMREQPDKSFDLAIVDPPYGIGSKLTSGGGSTTGWRRRQTSGVEKWDIAPNKEYFIELFRVSNNQIIWGGNYFDLPPCRQPICWDKIKYEDKNSSQWEYAWTSFEGRARLFRKNNNGGFVEKIQKIHICQKPVKLYDWLFRNYAERGQRILDTHLGSGSSAIAAHYFGVDFVGIEIDEDYYKAARERFDNETKQLSLIG